jgi:Ca2+-binding EF-hand superfamily protein
MYTAPSKLRHEAMKVFLKNISNDDFQELHEIFMAIDVGKDGFITGNDLRQVLGRFQDKISKREVRKIIRAVEAAPNHKINYTEFLMATVNLGQELTESKIYDVFQYFDNSGSGSIDIVDLASAYRKLGVEITFDELESTI